MILAKDLRIGNTIFLQDKPIKVGITTLERIVRRHPMFIGQYHPIPLTEEWLLKLGFEKNNRDTGWDLKLRISATALFCRFNTEWYFQLGNIYFGAAFKYVHQVQNFFQSITMQELTVKTDSDEN